MNEGNTKKHMIETKQDSQCIKTLAAIARENDGKSRAIHLLLSPEHLHQEEKTWNQEPLYTSKRKGSISKNHLHRTKGPHATPRDFYNTKRLLQHQETSTTPRHSAKHQDHSATTGEITNNLNHQHPAAALYMSNHLFLMNKKPNQYMWGNQHIDSVYLIAETFLSQPPFFMQFQLICYQQAATY